MHHDAWSEGEPLLFHQASQSGYAQSTQQTQYSPYPDSPRPPQTCPPQACPPQTRLTMQNTIGTKVTRACDIFKGKKAECSG
jgi:hypothetical protein